MEVQALEADEGKVDATKKEPEELRERVVDSSSASHKEEEEARKPVQITNESLVPNGGLRAWLCVFGSFLIAMQCHGVSQAYGAFQSYYEEVQLASPSSIAWIGGLQMSLVAFFGCFSGALFDAGYLKSMQAAASVLYVFCMLMTSLSTKYYQIVLSQGFGVGLAMGTLMSPALSCISHHLSTKRSLGIGLFGAGAAIGGIIYPIMLRKLLPLVGFAWTIRAMTLIIGVCLLGGFLTTSTTLPPRRTARVLDLSVFRDITYSILVASIALVGLGLYLPVVYGVTYAVHRGVDPTLAAYTLAAMNGCSLPGRILAGYYGNRVGTINLLIGTALASAVLIFCWTAVTGVAGIFVFMSLFGLSSGTLIAIMPAAIASITERGNEIGTRIGMCFFSISLFWMSAPPTQGAIISKRGYFVASMYCATITLAAAVLMGIARLRVARARGTPWV